MGTLNKNEVQSICNRLSDVSGSLKGVSGLFSQLSGHACLQNDELYGLGQLLSSFAEELISLEDLLSVESIQPEKKHSNQRCEGQN